MALKCNFLFLFSLVKCAYKQVLYLIYLHILSLEFVLVALSIVVFIV